MRVPPLTLTPGSRHHSTVLDVRLEQARRGARVPGDATVQVVSVRGVWTVVPPFYLLFFRTEMSCFDVCAHRRLCGTHSLLHTRGARAVGSLALRDR